MVKELRVLFGRGAQKVRHSTLLNRLIASKLLLPLVVLVSFFLLSLGIGGPAYMSDEIGYLSKASTIAGHTVFLSTSWFAGYSLMISPAFIISSDPAVIWHIIVGLNALMWAGIAALLRYVLTKTHPQASSRAIFFATAGALLYPSWLAMSGYAFATSGFVLVLMACLAALLKSNLSDRRWLSLAAVLAGYLSWIHPFGMIFLCAFIGLLGLKFAVERRFIALLVPLLSLVVALSYFIAVQPWFGNIMGAGVSDDSHYASSYAGLSQLIFTFDYWLQVAGLLVGLTSFVLVATFGVVFYGSWGVTGRLLHERRNWKQLMRQPALVVMTMSVLAVIGVIIFTALTWGVNEQLRIDQWIYGRYTDMYLLPLIGFGLLAHWRLKDALKLAAFVIVAGIILSLLTNPSNTSFAYINKVNLQSFWPIHLPVALRTEHYWVWGLLGAIGIAVVGWFGTAKRKHLLPLLLLPILLLAGLGNYLYQHRIVHGYTAPSSLETYIKLNYDTDDCIGFDPANDPNERYNLYSYYLTGYRLQKMTLEQWQNDCQGPYLTYDSKLAESPGFQLMGMELKTGLFMVTKTDAGLAPLPLFFN